MFCVLFFSVTLFAEMTIEIIEPADGAYFDPCQDIPIKAHVTATSETVRSVFFYTNGLSRGRVNEEPWETTRWTDVSTGNYILEARVIDEDRNEVWSDPVRVKVGQVSNGDKITNGDFTCGQLSGWNFNIYNEGNGEITLMDDGYFDDLYYIYYTSEEATMDWYVQFSQVVPVDSGHIYDIYFYADSDEPRPVTVGFQEQQEPYDTHVWQTVQIDGWAEYQIEGGIAQFTDDSNLFKFNLGGSDIPLYLDNIRVIDRSISSVKSKHLSWAGDVREYELYQAYPNPFNMSTTITFKLSEPTPVRLAIYNMQGHKVKTLLAEERAAGTYTLHWDGTNDSGSLVSSGVYIYTLTSLSAQMNLSRKILLMK